MEKKPTEVGVVTESGSVTLLLLLLRILDLCVRCSSEVVAFGLGRCRGRLRILGGGSLMWGSLLKRSSRAGRRQEAKTTKPMKRNAHAAAIAEMIGKRATRPLWAYML